MYNYRSWKGDSIYLESSAGSREYMLIYFWEMGTYFIWGWKHIFNGGMGRNLWGMNPPWICTPDLGYSHSYASMLNCVTDLSTLIDLILQSGNKILPRKLHRGIFTVFPDDNVDHNSSSSTY